MQSSNHTTILRLLVLSCVLLVSVTAAKESTATEHPPIDTKTPHTRVIGGDTVKDPFAFPYFAQLADASCSAALIHDDYMITAAHCERQNHPFYRRVLFGSTRLQQGILRQIQYTRAHPAYLPKLQDYDFALIKLSSSALVDKDGNPTGVEPIDFNRNASVPQPGDPLQAMGFGKISEQASGMNPTLQQVQIEYISDDTCRQQYGADQFYDHVMFCAGVQGGGKDTCQGDSGGPIVDINTNTIAGIVSYGIGCARPNFAGVNSRVSSVADWIEEEICRGSAYPPQYCKTRATDNSNEPLAHPTTNSVTLKGNETLGAMTLYVTLDNYPEEFAWSLTYLGTNPDTMTTEDELYVRLSDSIQEDGAEIEKSFDNLLPGQYDLQFGDNGLDGICCGFGKGELYLVNDLTGETVWEHKGNYRGYLQVRLDIDPFQGDIDVLLENGTFLRSWQRLSIPNYPPDFDPEWPGPMPDSPLFSFNVNFKYDAFPRQSAYDIYHLSDDNVGIEAWQTISTLDEDLWDEVDEVSGVRDGVHNELVPHRMVQQEAGWYWLRVVDFNNDGICCDFRRGWVSLTGPIITTMDYGFVWGNDGEFGSGVDVYFYMNDDGVIAHVNWIVAEDASAEEQRQGEGGKKNDNSRRLQTRQL